jgi:hypothetical protein
VEVYRRAYEGVEKPVSYQSVQCGSIKEYSDAMAMFILRAVCPEKYRE